MGEPRRRIDIINISRIPVAGLGGLGMIAVAIVMAVALPEARWVLLAGGAGGLLLGLALILVRVLRR